ncbi:beta-2-microglobulin-like [Anoplopoma fimbria]|uniref:Beta-2-microglobulin n=1 Tax=Anoplopoma fimbria TaxID=229290 RepID=C3KJ51_ANOFI|nr:beta-2-microglobulin-like [Anoplopoma fimbria]ACQ58673.1 Beta-2-microglobulin precursor [Anoplopoma fimbria]ACQ58744.1 Beta-2-microglobulin precursor [Anoplopoma fimbria]ACQ58892.1 Beta-2-microglobulin precursor [Anoplopoma fimbria]
MMLGYCLAALLAVCFAQDAMHTPPKVQVYSHKPGEYGKENTLICRVSGFHPPDITIELMKNDMEIPEAQQTDLAFKKGWHFHLTKNVAFTPNREDRYSCKVTHGTTVNNYAWEANM